MPTGVVTTDAVLSEFAAGLGTGGYIADLIAPPMRVRKQTAKIHLVDVAAETYRNVDDRRAPGAPSKRLDVNVTRPSTYNCEAHSRGTALPVEVLADENEALRNDMTYVSRLHEAVMVRKEILFLEKVVTNCTSNLTGTPSTKWDANGGTPIKDLKGYISTMETRATRGPNYLALGAKTLRMISDTSEFVAKQSDAAVKEGGLETLASELARMIGIDKVLVSKAGKNTAGSGVAASMSNVWDGSNAKGVFILGYQEAPSTLTGAAAIQTVWDEPTARTQGGAGGLEGGWAAYKWYDEATRSWLVDLEQYYDFVFPFGAGVDACPMFYGYTLFA